jgi:hypothetical protein
MAVGAGVGGGLLAATTGWESLATTNFEFWAGASAVGAGAEAGASATLLTVESLGAALVTGAASAGAAAVLSALAGCTELSPGAAVALAAGSLAGGSFLAKAAIVKASKARVVYKLSFDFMCLVRSSVVGHS